MREVVDQIAYTKSKKFGRMFATILEGNRADMLYSLHLSIADTFSRNQLFLAMVKPLNFEPLYSGHLSIADTFSEN